MDVASRCRWAGRVVEHVVVLSGDFVALWVEQVLRNDNIARSCYILRGVGPLLVLVCVVVLLFRLWA